jgi:hypothetical protein
MNTRPTFRRTVRLFAYLFAMAAGGMVFTACSADAVPTVTAPRMAPTGLLKLESSEPEQDSDGDGLLDSQDACPADAQNDVDGDGICGDVDVCPLDRIDDADEDGICGSDDVCPADPQNDIDGDYRCADFDACPLDPLNDQDADGLCQPLDNCPASANADQVDRDGDGVGDECDPDLDGDGAANESDNCAADPDHSQADFDRDGVGDACDPDVDGDSVLNAVDACSNTALGTNVNQQGCNLVTYAFSGFIQPVDNAPTVNTVKAGSAVPVKFSLGGDYGLDIFMAGSPRAVTYACGGGAIDAIEQTVAATVSGLTYSAATGQYTYVWKTDKLWAGGCRRLELSLKDGSTHVALFNFSR